MAKKPARRDWVVRIRATVTKDLFVRNATEQEARDDPYDFCEDEEEVDQVDYDVLNVEPNE